MKLLKHCTISTLLSIVFFLPTFANAALVNYVDLKRTAGSSTNNSVQFGFGVCGTDSITSTDNLSFSAAVSSNSVSGGGCDSRTVDVASSSGSYDWSGITSSGWSFRGDSTASADAGAQWGSGATGSTTVDVNFESDVAINLILETTTTDVDQPASFTIAQCNASFTSCGVLSSGNGVGLENLDMSDFGTLQAINFVLGAGNYRFLTQTRASAVSGISQPGEVESELLDYSVNFSSSVSTVPVPAAAWLFGSGLIGLLGLARHKKA